VIEATRGDRVRSLLYIAALAPDEGEMVTRVFYRDEPHPDAPKPTPDQHGCVGLPVSWKSISDELKTWGGEAPRIHIELFGPGQSLEPAVLEANRKTPHAVGGEQGDGPKISFTKSGLTVSWAPRFRSILELAEACDVPVKWSCRTGVCHTCECGLVEGSLTYSPQPLDPPSDGNALICCSMPLGDIQLDL
jgi:ferredoxin